LLSVEAPETHMAVADQLAEGAAERQHVDPMVGEKPFVLP